MGDFWCRLGDALAAAAKAAASLALVLLLSLGCAFLVGTAVFALTGSSPAAGISAVATAVIVCFAGGVGMAEFDA